MASINRANVDLSRGLIKEYRVKSAVTLSLYQRVKFSTGNGGVGDEVDAAAAGDVGAFGTVVGLPISPGLSNQPAANGTNGSNMPTTVTGDGTDKYNVSIALDGVSIVPMTVGTGGSTLGAVQVYVSTGVTDGVTAGGGSVAHPIAGRAMQPGVAGDLIGVMPMPGIYVAAS